MIFGPRIKAVKKIYHAARDFVGTDDGDVTSVTIYLSHAPITGNRGVQLDDAYNMMMALAKAGWVVVEDGDAMSVRITDAGVRAAT